MGVVYRAYDTRLRREVALKRMRGDALTGEGNLRLLREAQSMAQLTHPNVAVVYDVEPERGGVTISMELIEGPTLRTWLRDEHDWREVLLMFIAAGRGLQAAHHHGLVHRDFKPSNVLIGADGRPRVVDFGLARFASGVDAEDRPTSPVDTITSGAQDAHRSPVTLTGTVLGTPAYMPPEQFAGLTTPRSDQYAFCVALWWALTGQFPFDPKLPHGSRARPSPWPTAPRVPAGLVAALRRGLHLDPGDRWSSMSALLQQLEAAVRPGWRRRGVAVGAVGAVAALVMATRAPSPDCDDGQVLLAGVWDESVKESVRGRLTRPDQQWTARVAAEVDARLDAYADRWRAGYRDACEAAQQREQSERVRDLRLDCLDLRWAALAATVESLGNSSDALRRRAIASVDALPSLERCNDVAALLADVPPPEDPTVEVEVDELRRSLARLDPLWVAGERKQTEELLSELVRRAEAVDYPPVVVEVGYRHAFQRYDRGDVEPALVMMRQVYERATEHGHDRVAARAANALIRISASQTRWEEAEAWIAVARGLARKLEPGGSIEADLESAIGQVYRKRSEIERAATHLRRALTMQESLHGGRSLPVATALTGLGIVLFDSGDLPGAREALERALAIREEQLGPGHPDLARVMMELANVSIVEGDPERGLREHQAALALSREAVGDDHPEVAKSLVNMGIALKHLGRHDEAAAAYEESLRIHEARQGPNHPDVAIALLNLALARKLQGDLTRAEASAARAVSVFERAFGPEHQDVGRALVTLGEIRLDQDEVEQAEHDTRRAVKLLTAGLGADNPTTAAAENNLAVIWHAQGRVDESRELFGRYLAKMVAVYGPEHPAVERAEQTQREMFELDEPQGSG